MARSSTGRRHRPPPERVRTALRLALLVLVTLLGVTRPVAAEDTRFSFGGHVKYRFLGTLLPNDSLLRELADSPTLDHALELRLNLSLDRGPWRFDAGYQALGLYGDTIELTRELPPEYQAFYPRYPRDPARLVDLTHVIRDRGRLALVQRLDRLSFGYSGTKLVLRAGRQALSWGNGLVYTPMDILNPFDPAAVDKEYKNGDDMLYGQYLRDDGDDLQAVAVFRRDPQSEDVTADASSFALKYHALAGRGELDALAARHFGDGLLGLGGNLGIGGAVWRADLVVTFGDRKTVLTGVTSLSYSWTWAGKNWSGLAEYFFNGFGQPDGDYAPESLAENPELTARIARGELFTLGRHYLAGAVTVEVHPLLQVTPTVLANLSDKSALVQISAKGDLREDLVLLAAVNLPLGARGTEYGGIPSDVPDKPLSTGPALFLQLGWYF
jgi:hypothetical protein